VELRAAGPRRALPLLPGLSPPGRPVRRRGRPRRAKAKGKGKGGAPVMPAARASSCASSAHATGSMHWIHCPKLKDIRAQRGKDWSPSAADGEAAS